MCLLCSLSRYTREVSLHHEVSRCQQRSAEVTVLEADYALVSPALILARLQQAGVNVSNTGGKSSNSNES